MRVSRRVVYGRLLMAVSGKSESKAWKSAALWAGSSQLELASGILGLLYWRKSPKMNKQTWTWRRTLCVFRIVYYAGHDLRRVRCLRLSCACFP